MSFRRFLAHVGIEGVAGEMCEMLDVFERDRAFLGKESLPDIEVFEVIAERMLFLLDHRCALDPACRDVGQHRGRALQGGPLHVMTQTAHAAQDRKSTRLNSSHLVISYAVFCLKKKTN